MIINKTVYTCGNLGTNIESIIKLMRLQKSPNYYFVYTTNNNSFLYQIGAYETLMRERGSPIIVGIGETKKAALKIVCFLLSKRKF